MSQLICKKCGLMFEPSAEGAGVYEAHRLAEKAIDDELERASVRSTEESRDAGAGKKKSSAPKGQEELF